MISLAPLFTSERRYVLLIGGGGASLGYINRGQIEKFWNINDFSVDSLDIFTAALDRHPYTPLLILIDTVEQSYRRETIPPVNMFDRRKVLKRRLGIAFPTQKIRSAMALDEVVGPRGDPAYLFVALTRSSDMELWIDFIHGLRNPIGSIGLLPLESSSLASALSAALAITAEWTLLISRQRSGGIRQIVAHNGRLVLTRLTPAPSDALEADGLAEVMAQEMSTTQTYLTRLGFGAGDHLHIIVIGPQNMRNAVKARQPPGCSVSLTTASEAANLLELDEIDIRQDAYGDALHMVWSASKRSLALNMADRVLGRRRLQLAAAQKWATTGLAMTAVALGLFCTGLFLDRERVRQEVIEAQATQALLSRLAGNLIAIIIAYPVRPKMMNAVLDLHDALSRRTTIPMPVLAQISSSLGPAAKLNALSWIAQTSAEKSGFRVNLAIDLGAFSDIDQAIAETNALAERLRRRFTGSDVVILRPPLNILPGQTLVGSNSGQPPADDTRVFSADITLMVSAP